MGSAQRVWPHVATRLHTGLVASWRVSAATYRRITAAAIAALVFIIVTGGGVRLTGSGLGCSDWPTCEEGQLVAPLEYHAMVEFVNRTITGLVSVAVALAVLGSLRREPRRKDLTLLSLGLVVGVIAQILIGALVVKTELVPAAVSAHFLVSILLVWNAVVLHKRASEPEGAARRLVPPSVEVASRVRVACTAAVLTVGTMVTGAGPHSGDPGKVERLDLDLRGIARVHSLTAWVLVAATVVTATLLVRSGGGAALRRREQAVLAAVLAQGAIGYAQYAAGVPPLLVALHLLGSAVVFCAVLWAHLGLRTREPLQDPAPGEHVEISG